MSWQPTKPTVDCSSLKIAKKQTKGSLFQKLLKIGKSQFWKMCTHHRFATFAFRVQLFCVVLAKVVIYLSLKILLLLLAVLVYLTIQIGFIIISENIPLSRDKRHVGVTSNSMFPNRISFWKQNKFIGLKWYPEEGKNVHEDINFDINWLTDIDVDWYCPSRRYWGSWVARLELLSERAHL